MSQADDKQYPADSERRAQLTGTLRRVVLLKETGPKSAAWHRARVQTIWRLHKLLDAQGQTASDDLQAQQSPDAGKPDL